MYMQSQCYGREKEADMRLSMSTSLMQMNIWLKRFNYIGKCAAVMGELMSK
jgi:hypothetical protein